MTAKQQNSGVGHFEVDDDQAGQRLDNFLIARLKGVPRSHVYQLIRSGQVRVNSGRVRAHHRLESGDRVRVPPIRRRAPASPAAGQGGLGWLEARIIHEDDRLIVVDKPAGLAVHGGSGLEFGLIEGLRTLRPTARSLELVHRLDRGTSGCLLVAKRRSALRQLHALLREGQVHKRYLALVRGRWEHGDVEIDAPLSVRREGGGARARVDAGGKEAVSRFRLVSQYGAFASLVDVEILTGRTHQIRAHALSAGHPIAGDDRYGDRDFNARCEARGLKRMFLHAQLVEFVWPDTGEEFVVSAPLPEELRHFLDTIAG